MFHQREVPQRADFVKKARVGRPALGVLLFGLLLVGVPACQGTTTVQPEPRFGQVGQIRVEVTSLLPDSLGLLTETLVWRSDGAWTLAERVFYRNLEGSVTIRRSHINPGELTAEYASLIRQLNETPGLRILGGAVEAELEPMCDPRTLPSRVTFTIQDDFRGETARWTRCARGTLLPALMVLPGSGDVITPGASGPDAGASRVITAAQLTRFFTLGEGVSSVYKGTLPYATLDQGEHSGAMPPASRSFVSSDGTAPQDFLDFWSAHAGGDTPLPEVRWEREIVLLAAVGERTEAGSVVQVTRVVPIGAGTRVELGESVSGDFCSPAARKVHPYHLVVVPAVPLPVEFASPVVQRVPCGL